MWRAGATALRRATGSLQYFPYTDLTAPSENAKNGGAWCSTGLPLAPTCPASSCGGGICAQKVSPGGARSIHPNASVVFAVDLLPRRCAQAVPGIAHLVVVDLRRIIRGVEAERLDVEPPGGAEQRIGGDHAIPLRADQPRAGGREVLLRVEDLERRALARLRFLLHAGERDGGRAYLRFRGGERNLCSLEGDPGAEHRGLGLIADELQHDAGLHRDLRGLPDLRGRQPAVVKRHVRRSQERGDIVALGAERGIVLPLALETSLHREGRPQAALGDLGAELSDIDVVHRRQNGGMILAADRERVLARARQQPVDRFRPHPPARRHADDPGRKPPAGPPPPPARPPGRGGRRARGSAVPPTAPRPSASRRRLPDASSWWRASRAETSH